MKQEDITIEDKKQSSLKNSVKDGSFYSIMWGFGEHYVAPFALALNATSPQIAFLTSIPQLLSSLFQLISAKVTDLFKNRKTLVMWSVLIQALIWFPLFLIPFFTQNIPLLISFFTIYTIAGSFATPAWNSWMGDLVEENRRGRYFGYRNKIIGFFSFASIFAAGFILNSFTKINPFIGFGFIFSIALIARLTSFFYVKRMYEPRYIIEKKDTFSFISFTKRLRKTNYGRFVIFIFFYRFAVSISAPFFTVYMLRELGFSYWTFTLITGMATITSFLTMTYWGRYGDRFGNKKVLTVTSLIIPIIPILWIISSTARYLFFIQLFSGFVWAGFNLSSANFIFDAVPSAKRARCNAYFNLYHGISIFLGASLGGYFTKILPTTNFFFSNILIIFVISGFLRLCFAILFLPKLKEERKVDFIPDSRLLFNVVAVDPVKGLIYESATGMRVIKNVGEFGFKGFKTGVKTINKLVKDLEDAIKKRRELKYKQMFAPKQEKEYSAKELDYMIKELDKKIKKIREIKDDHLREPE